MATAFKRRTEQRRSHPSALRNPVLKSCYDLEEKNRYRQLLQSLNVNVDAFRRSSVDVLPTSTSFSEQNSNRPTTSFHIESTLSELKRLQNSINYSTSSLFTSNQTQNRFGLNSNRFPFNPNRSLTTPNSVYHTYSSRSSEDPFKSAYYYAKNSLDKLDQFGFSTTPKFSLPPESSSTPDVISLDGEDILANYERDKKASKTRTFSENGTKKSTPDILSLNKRFESDPSNIYLKFRNEFFEDRKLRQKRAQELNVEADMRQKARQAKQKNVETEIRFRMRFEGLVIAEHEEEEELFIALSDEQLDLVEQALGPGNSQEVLIDAFNQPIKRSDMRTLSGLNWLNDEIINFYFNLIMDRSGKNELPSAYVFNTFFYPKLCQGGHAALKRWTRKVDVFKYDLILIPIHLGVHWCLAVVDFQKKEILYYDSMGGRNKSCAESLLQYLMDESQDKKKEKFVPTNWKMNFVSNIPQQMNGSDCGVFACKFAEYVSRNAEINFTQEHMPYFRKRMVYEILTKALM